MNNRNTTVGATAFVTMLFVLYTGLPLPTSSLAEKEPEKQPTTVPTPPTSAKDIAVEKSRATGLMAEFFGIPVGSQSSLTKKLAAVEVKWLIATIPDPEQSRLPYLADAYFDALQRAAETDGYVQDRLKFPWKKDRKVAAESTTEKNTVQPEKDEFERTPGVILFRKSVEGKTKLLVMFLVGETPTSGVHKEALKNALQQVYELSRDSSELKVLGPALSGSATSLSMALKDWLNTKGLACPFTVKVIGTATAVNQKEFTDRGVGNLCPGSTIIWNSTLFPDDYARQAFYDYLLNRLKTITTPTGNSHHPEVALLTEGTTAYGQTVRSSPEKNNQPVPGPTPTGKPKPEEFKFGNYKNYVLNLTFPLHISRLRSMASKNQTIRGKGANDPFNLQSSMTRLPLDEDQGTSVPIYSDVSASYAEVVLATILEEIEREHIRYLGIVATDIRDRIFLAREIRRHSPNLVLFFQSSELLFLHPEVNRDLQGSLLISTYPLAPQSKLWSPSFFQQKRWLQFPVQSAQGVYNAALALLDRPEAMQEYEPPSFGEAVSDSTKFRGPALWLSVVGRDNIWPLTTLELSQKYLDVLSKSERSNMIQPEEYLYQKALLEPSALEKKELLKSRERLHSQASFIAFYGLILLVCLLPTYGALSTFWRVGKRLIDKLRSFRQQYLGKVKPAKAVYQVEQEKGQPKSISSQFVWMIFGDLASPGGNNLNGMRQVHLTGCLLAMLCLSIPVWLISAVPVWYRGYWRSFAAWDKGLIIFGLLSTTGIVILQVIALYRSTRQLRISWADALPDKIRHRNTYSKRDFGVLVTFVIGMPLVALILLVFFHFLTFFIASKPETLLLLWERTVGNFSGVSPLMPLALIATATLTWSLSSLRRLRLLERRRPLQSNQSHSRLNGSELGFLSLEVGQDVSAAGILEQTSEGLCEHEQKIYRLISCPINQLPGWRSIATGMVLACLMTMGVDMMPSVEGGWYNRGITALFTMAYLAITFNFVRFLAIWAATNKLLTRLSWHPLLMGYRMPDPETDPVLGRLRLDISSPIPTFTTLTKSVGQARIFWQVIQKSNPGYSSKVNPLHIKTAEGALSDAYHFDAIGEWQLAFDARTRVRSKLVDLSYDVASIVRKQWITELQGKPQPALSGSANNLATEPVSLLPYQSQTRTDLITITDLPKEILERGELFLVSRLIGYLQYVMAQMQNLVFFVTAGLLLMLAAMLTYPFQPMSPLLIFNWITILTVVVVTMLVFIQMNRNPTLSLLSGTKPGELNWNSQFILQVVIHGLLPLLAIAGAQFSDSLREIMMSLGLTLGGAAH